MGKKVFLGGLSWSSTPESLCSFFTALDFEVEKAVIMCDKQTGKSRGFGFIVFADSCTKELQSHYEVEGRLVEVKTALRKHEIIAPVKQHTKIFVGGIPQEVTWEELLAYFSQFGEVIGGQIMIDKKTKRSRGFGFVKFLHEESVTLAFSIEHYIHFKKIEIKIAESNPKKLQKNSIESSFENSEATSFEAEGSDSIYERTWVNPSMALGNVSSKKPPQGRPALPPRDESGSTTASSRSARSTSSAGLEALHETAVSRSESLSEYGRSDDSADDSNEESEEILRFSKGYGPSGHKSNFKIQSASSAKPVPYQSPLMPARATNLKSHTAQPNSRGNVQPTKSSANMTSSTSNIEVPFGRFVNPVFNAQLYGHNYPQHQQHQPQYNQQQNFQSYPPPQNASYPQNYPNVNFNINSPRNMSPNVPNPNINPNYGPYQNSNNNNFNPKFPPSNYNPGFDQAKATRSPPVMINSSYPIDDHVSNHDLDFMLFKQDYKIEATPREISLNSELSQSFAPEIFPTNMPTESPQSHHKEPHHKERTSSISNPKSLRKFLSTSTSKIAFSKSSITSSGGSGGGEESPPRNFIVLLFSAFSDKKTVVSVKRELYAMPIRDFVEHAASKENLDLKNNWTIVGTYGPFVQDNLGLKLVIKPADTLVKPFSALSLSGGIPFKDRANIDPDFTTTDQFANQHHSLFGTGSLIAQLNWNSESFTPTEQEKLKIGNPVFNIHTHARS